MIIKSFGAIEGNKEKTSEAIRAAITKANILGCVIVVIPPAGLSLPKGNLNLN